MHPLLCECYLCEAIRYHERLANEEQAKVGGLKNKVEGLRNEVNGLRNEVNGLQNKVRELEAGRDVLNARLDNLEAEVRSLPNEHDQAKTRSTAAEAENREMKRLIKPEPTTNFCLEQPQSERLSMNQ